MKAKIATFVSSPLCRLVSQSSAQFMSVLTEPNMILRLPPGCGMSYNWWHGVRAQHASGQGDGGDDCG